MPPYFTPEPAPWSARDSTGRPCAPGALYCPCHDRPDDGPDEQFIEMLDAYRGTGGLAPAQEVLALFRRSSGPDVATLTRWITERRVICFEWKSRTWFPWFQFNRRDMVPQPALHAVFAELSSVYDHWQLAIWFARSSPWLANRTPVDMLPHDLAAVLQAARADRFAATG